MRREYLRKVFEKIKQGKEKLSEQTVTLKKTEKNRKSEREMYGSWGTYDSGAFDGERDVDGYFGKSSDSFKNVSTFEQAKDNFHKLDEPGMKSLSLDVMGQGRIGYELGADLSLGWTYKKLNIPELPGRKVEVGDLMKIKILKRMLSDLKDKILNEGYNLNAVWFRAIGGFGMYYKNLYAVSYMYEEIFRELYTLANIGCKFYFSMHYGSEKEGSNQSELLMIALKEIGFDVVLDSKGGNYVLTKTKELQTLPSLREISRNNDILGPNIARLKDN